jgi:hypothetical protein
MIDKSKLNKLNKLKDLAEILDSRNQGGSDILLLKKIQNLKLELSKLQELLGVVENKTTEKTGEILNTLNQTYFSLESKINDLSKQDIKLSKDTQYAENYLKNELATIKNTISNLKLQHGKDGQDGKDAEPINTATIALEASKLAQDALKPLIPIFPTSEEIVAQIPIVGEKVRDSLELLQGEERLSASAIKDLPKAIETGAKYYGGSGIKEVIAGTNITVDNSTLGYPKISTISSGHTIEEEGVALTQRSKLNFVGASITATDGGAITDDTIITSTAPIASGFVKITVGMVEPTSPNIGDLWVDTN